MARAVGGEQGSKRFRERSTPSSADVLAGCREGLNSAPEVGEVGHTEASLQEPRR